MTLLAKLRSKDAVSEPEPSGKAAVLLDDCSELTPMLLEKLKSELDR